MQYYDCSRVKRHEQMNNDHDMTMMTTVLQYFDLKTKEAREAKRVSTMAKVNLTMRDTKCGTNDKRLCVGK